MTKKQYLFSFVLATLSFIAARSLEKIGVQRFYVDKASQFVKEDGYFDLEHPNSIVPLPMGNMPLSDLTLLDSTQMFCIQSSTGGVVIYDLDSNKISASLSLGIQEVIRDIVVVDSSLLLFDENMSVYRSYAPFDSLHTTQLTKGNTSWKSASICHHAMTHRLFIVGSVDNLEQTERFVYTYNLNNTKFQEEPLFQFDVSALETFAQTNNIKINTFKVNAMQDTVLGFNFIPTAIAVHPKTNDIYILSSIDRTLAVFNQFGELVNLAVLEPRQFPVPSGMVFNAQGDLYISNNDLMNNSMVKVMWNKLFQKKSGHGLIFGR
jgi:hypothetical protein